MYQTNGGTALGIKEETPSGVFSYCGIQLGKVGGTRVPLYRESMEQFKYRKYGYRRVEGEHRCEVDYDEMLEICYVYWIMSFGYSKDETARILVHRWGGSIEGYRTRIQRIMDNLPYYMGWHRTYYRENDGSLTLVWPKMPLVEWMYGKGLVGVMRTVE